MIGPDQEEFLRGRLEESPARWKVVCQQVMMAQRLFRDTVATDPWDGYPVQRDRILEMFGASGGVAVLTGDIHSSWACELGFAPGDDDDAAVAIELVTPSISSRGMSAEQAGGVYDRIGERCRHVRYAELTRRGYLAVELDETELRGTFHHVGGTAAVIASARETPHLRRIG